MEEKIRLEESWKRRLQAEFGESYMKDLKAFLRDEYSKKKVIYPKPAEYFAALDHTPFEKVKVVILGQDPYHGPGQAHGLSFSVPPGVPIPPSLQNIFKEIQSEFGFVPPKTGHLMSWADQGVLLLNATLTVVGGQAGSHQKKGWEQFTDKVVRVLNEEREHLVFMLWGSYAQKKGEIVDRKKHLVLSSPHPSPLSAHRGFLGNGHFKKANEYLEKNGLAPIDWRVC